jgi:plastocyanin
VRNVARSVGCVLLTLAAIGGARGAGPTASQPSAKAATHTVVIENLRFVPDTLEIRRGDTVVWENRDLVPHTATAQGRFDSGNIAPQAAWRHRFDTAGTLAVICRYHPTMKAQVTVK